MFIFLEGFRDPFVTAAEATSQSSSGTRANLHKVETADKDLLLGESVEYTASQAHRPTPVPTTHSSIPPPATRAKLRFSPKIIFLGAGPVVGRDDEIDRVVSILSRKSKNSAVLVGAAGVGKTAIAEGLAQRLACGGVPGPLV